MLCAHKPVWNICKSIPDARPHRFEFIHDIIVQPITERTSRLTNLKGHDRLPAEQLFHQCVDIRHRSEVLKIQRCIALTSHVRLHLGISNLVKEHRQHVHRCRDLYHMIEPELL